jgi:hypothetical protein
VAVGFALAIRPKQSGYTVDHELRCTLRWPRMALARVIAFKPQCRFDRRQMSQEFVDVFFQKRLDEEMFDCSFKEWGFLRTCHISPTRIVQPIRNFGYPVLEGHSIRVYENLLSAFLEHVVPRECVSRRR